jgi:hypothetical protein
VRAHKYQRAVERARAVDLCVLSARPFDAASLAALVVVLEDGLGAGGAQVLLGVST